MDNGTKKYSGILLLHKRADISSHQAVIEVRQIIKQKRVGHTGTLDPKAEGLVVICIGRATKIVQFVSDFDKSYEAEICLGRTSTTYDSEGTIKDNMPKSAPELTLKEWQSVLNEFTGQVKQRVPVHSAVRVNGNRLYEMARAGVSVEPPVRTIEIKSIEPLSYENPHLKFRVTCSKGTYIRSLANDIGERLECGAYLSKLLRIKVGSLDLNDALQIQDIRKLHEANMLFERLLSFDDVLNFSGLVVSDEFSARVLEGLDLKSSDVVATLGEFSEGDRILLKDREGTPLAIGRAEIASKELANNESEKIFTYTRVLN